MKIVRVVIRVVRRQGSYWLQANKGISVQITHDICYTVQPSDSNELDNYDKTFTKFT